MSNYNQQRFDMGVEAAYAWWKTRKQGEKSVADIHEEYRTPSENHIRRLNELHNASDYAWGNAHVFKHIADTVFSSFMPDIITRDLSPDEADELVALSMSGVNGHPVVEVQHFIERQ